MSMPENEAWGPTTPAPRYGHYAPVPPPDGTVPPPGAPQPPAGQPPYQGQHDQGGYGAPQYGGTQNGQPQYGGAQYGQPQYGAPQGAPSPWGGPGAGLPTKPGIIPLRPLRLGEFLDGAFGALRANPRVMLGMTAVITSAAAVLAVLVTAVLPLTDWLLGSEFEEAFLVSGSAALDLGPSVGALLLSIALPAVSGLLIFAVSRAVLGDKVGVRAVWDQVKRQLLRLIALALLVSAGTVTLVFLVALPVIGLALGTDGSAGAIVVATIFAIVAGVLAVVWFSVRTLLIAPVLVLERLTLGKAIVRGWRLTRGSFWRILGIYVVMQIIVQIVASILVTPFAFVGGLLAAVMTSQVIAGVLVMVGFVLSYTITAAFSGSVLALIYIDVRMRREGLDVELAAAAARTSAG